MYTVVLYILLVSIIGSSYALLNITSSPYTCDFGNQVLNSRDLQSRLWGMAQQELGIVPDFEALRNNVFVKEFYGGRNFGFSAYVVNNKPVFYTRIWKNGNSGIRVSLFVHAREKDPNNFCPKGGNKCTPDDFDYKEEGHEEVAEKLVKQTGNPINSFSFIRRPISHFLSGLREYYFIRNYRASRPELKKEYVSPSDLAIFLRSFVDVTRPAPKGVFTAPYAGHLATIPHVYPQATIFRESYGSHVLGRMENFSADWRQMQRAFGIDVPIRKEFGDRESSKDAAKVGESWTTLMAHRPEYTRALCWLLLPDYLCYNYPLPVQCEDMVHKLKFAYLQ